MSASATPPLARWTLSALIEPLPGGHRNRAFRTVGLRAGWVFKTTGRSEEALLWLDGVFDHAEAAGFRVPRLRRSARGRLIEQGWTAEPFMDGAPVLREDLGSLLPGLRRLHALGAGLRQRPGFCSAAELLVAEEGGDVNLSTMPADLVQALRDAWAPLRDAPTAALHGDLSPSNVLRDREERVALIDWDEARVDATAFDLAALGGASPTVRRAAQAWEIACCWHREPRRARDLARELQG